jgi:hypothetical protein
MTMKIIISLMPFKDINIESVVWSIAIKQWY